MEAKGFDGSLCSVFSPDPPTQRTSPGLHFAVGRGPSYGIGQLLNPERAAGDRLGTDAQFGHPPSPEGLVRKERHHDGGDARKDSDVVPAPPWCTVAWTRSNCQSQGTSSTLKTVSGKSASPIPLQPVASIPLWPASFSARSTMSVSLSGSMLFMLPNPTNMGGGPESRKSVNFCGACHSTRRSKNQ
jgi:hypothetical protein